MFNLFKKKYRFVVVGPGKIAQKHCEKFLSMGHKLVSVYSPNLVKNNFFNKNNTINNLEELKNIQFDYGLITSPNKFHKSQIEKFLELKKPVFVEKPVMILANDFDDIKKTFPNDYLKIFGGFNLRYQKNTNFIKNIKDKNIQSVNIKWVKEFQPKNNWSLNLNISCGGILIDWGIHAIDLLDYLINEKFEIIDIKFNNIKNKIEHSFILNLKTNSKIDINVKMSWILSDEYIKNPLEIEFKSLNEDIIWHKSGEVYSLKDLKQSKIYNSNFSNIHEYFTKHYLQNDNDNIIKNERIRNFTSYHKVATLIENLYRFKS